MASLKQNEIRRTTFSVYLP